jgi:ADP-heptose:LPS heptosyltransferase
VTGTRDEAHLVEPIVESASDGTTAALRLSLPALLALVSSADLVVSNDTGPLHLAIAAGTPTVGLFWVGNLINAGPFSRRQHRPLLSWRMLCPVCGTDASVDRCEHNPSFIAEIPVRSVIDAATDLLQAR